MGIPLVAAGVRVPEITSPLDNQSKLVSLRSMIEQQKLIPGQLEAQQQENQVRQLQIQQAQYQADQQKALNDAYRSSVSVDANGQMQIDQGKLTKVLSDSGHGSAVPSIMEGINKYQESVGNLAKLHQELQVGAADAMGSVASAIKASNYDPHLAHTVLDTMGNSPQVAQIRNLIDTNPDAFKQQVDSAVAQSPAQQKMANERKIAELRSGKEGELPLGEKVPQLNQGLQSRYQVLNPGKPLPPQFTLPANATQKDFDRVDNLLKQTESATGVKAQQDAAAAAREQARQDRLQSQQDKIEKEGIQPVTGTDANGNDVLVSAGDAKKMGLTNVMKADADLVNKSTAARHWLQLADKPGTDDGPADKMGILQLIDKMDKEGKLGTVASRWNDFLSGKVGDGDPDYTALRAKMGLSSTKLMQAHVGSRGGSFMMEHFEDLANAKKMDADNLRAGVLSELNYMQDVAMQPQKAGGGAASKGGSKDPFAQFGGTQRK